jgi:DNA-binding transcriptional LysR family regulator
MRLYATQKYLDGHVAPLGLDDLGAHRLICQATTSTQVGAGAALVQKLMTHAVGSRLTVNNYFGVLQGVLNHLGIGVLPDYVAEGEPKLVRVLDDVESVEVPVFLAYPEELRQSKRIAAFRDFVMKEIQQDRRKAREAAAAGA